MPFIYADADARDDTRARARYRYDMRYAAAR